MAFESALVRPALGMLIGALIFSAGAAPAQTGSVEMELNTATDVPEGCRLTYVATNGTPVPLDRTSWEIAAFNGAGDVAAILVLEFGALPVGKTRVVQFDLPQMGCSTISRLLVNDQRDCTGSDGKVQDICMRSLAASSRLPGIRFGL